MISLLQKKIFKSNQSPLLQKSTNENGVTVTLAELIALRSSSNTIKLPRKHIQANQSGNYYAKHRGRGMEFDEVRSYQAGDDIRHMDWRVTARTGQAHTKLYREERERPVFILVDYSPSMLFATRVAFKSVVAARTAAILAWAAAQQGDRVGGMIYANNHITELLPRSGQHGVLPYLKALADQSVLAFQQRDVSTSHATALSAAPLTEILKHLQYVVHPGSLIIILSDFYQSANALTQPISQLCQHNEILAGFIYDQLEKDPPPLKQYVVTDGQQQLALDTTDSNMRHQYQLLFHERYQTFTQFCQHYRLRNFSIATHDPLLPILQILKR